VGGVSEDVISPPPGELVSETNDNSVAILLTYGNGVRPLGWRRRGERGVRGGFLPSLHTRRSRVARHDRWRHPRVLEAANLTSTFYPNLYPNPPQHHPTQADIPRRGSPGNPCRAGHYPTSTGTQTRFSGRKSS
jgi:hypothetical protein